MGTSFDERISALVDDELSSFESRRLVDELVADSALKRRWGRYHLIGDVLRDEVYLKADDDFAAGVMERIKDEAVPSLPLINTNAWLKPVAGVAIAASVASVSVLGLKNMTSEGMVAPAGIVAAESAAPVQAAVIQVASPVAVTANGVVQSVSIEIPSVRLPEDNAQPPASVFSDPRMNSYLATHAEFAARPGIMPRIRVVGFEPSEK